MKQIKIGVYAKAECPDLVSPNVLPIAEECVVNVWEIIRVNDDKCSKRG